MINWRILPATGKCYLVSNYPDLFSRMYVGDTANQTAIWWYRCNDSNNPNESRSTAGIYFRVIDYQGMFLRVAGANSEYKIADATPYDGKSIGEFIPDRIRNIVGTILSVPVKTGAWENGPFWVKDQSSQASELVISTTGGNNFSNLGFDLTRVGGVPTGPENNPASISLWYGITY
jgi:hypothetical protein